MKKKLLCCALLGAMSMAHSAMAQDFDDRWYISGTAGVLAVDDERGTSNAGLYGMGVGKMVTKNVSIDIDYTRANTDIEPLPNASWDLASLTVTGRYHFLNDNNSWWPYIAAGIGAQKNTFSGVAADSNSNMLVILGVGLQAEVNDRVDVRIEGGARFDFNDDFDAGHYQDLYATASVLFALGNLPAAVVPDAPPAEDCSTKDDDNDGVNNCNDRCPNSQAGETVGADGCKVEVAIDLKGVNFNFDKDTLRPDAIAILDNAAEVLNRYPTMRVSVDGHTDLCGSDTYNQDLSQRRAQVVYNYLTAKGVDAGRLGGPTGYGESRPLEATSQDFPACKSETNRRTELKSN